VNRAFSQERSSSLSLGSRNPLEGLPCGRISWQRELLSVGAEKALQRPRVFVTSAILGGAEVHSHIAPKLPSPKHTLLIRPHSPGWLLLAVPYLPLEALPEPVLGIVKRRQACYWLDIDDGRLRCPGRPHGHRCGQDQVVVVAFSPVLVGIVAGCDVDLDAEVQELFAEEFGKLQ
jgi:hypothetical protein